MEHPGFRAGARRWRFATRALIVAALVAAVAVLAVSADAGTSAPRLASVQRAPEAPIGANALGAPAAGSVQTGYVALKPRDEQALQSFIASVNKPHTSLYHQYLKPGQFDSRFGPSSATVAAVRSQLSADGLTVTSVARDGLLVGFSGTTASVETAFGTKLERYKSAAGITGEQSTKAISLPTSISSDVAAVIGLNTLVHPEADLVRPSKSSYAAHAAAKTSSVTHYTGAPDPCSAAINTAAALGGLTDDQIANAYGATSLYANDTGTGVNIGVYELEPYASSDLRAFDQCYFGSHSTPGGISLTEVDGGQPTGFGSGESILDIEDVSAMAPGAHIDVYEAPDTSAGSLDEYAQMVDDDGDQIITSSWGLCEQDLQLSDPGAQQAESYIFQQAAAQGQTVLSAAGDTGDDTCNEVRDVPPPTDQNPLSVMDPASQPYVVAVGGTTIQDADPSNYDETVWNDGAVWGGGGGGISMTWAAPSWQLTAPYFSTGYGTDLGDANTVENDASAEGISQQDLTPGFCAGNATAGFNTTTPTCRTLPDVSAQADEFTGAVTIYDDGQWETIGGTSSATPIWAGMLALVDGSSYCSNAGVTNIGFASPLLYAVAAAAGTESNGRSEYEDSFHDITTGNNDVFGFDNGKVFAARTGYDLASGLGSPNLTNSDGSPGLAENLCDLAAANRTSPVVTGISPSYGPVTGTTPVTISGSGFGTSSSPLVSSVTVGNDVIPYGTDGLTVVDGTPSTLTLDMPAGTTSLASSASGGSQSGQDGAGQANIVVTLTSGVSSIPAPSSEYEYVDETSGVTTPSISSISPYAGLETDTPTPVTIYGSGFAPGDVATIDGVAFTDVTYENPWKLRATPPAYSSLTPNSACLTNAALTTETVDLGNYGAGGDANPAADIICQAEVVVTNSSGDSSTPTDPAATYLGAEPQTDQDALFEVPSPYELSPVSDEYDYVPAPTITAVSTQGSSPASYADADPGAYGTPTVITITGTGLNYQTFNWLDFGDTSSSASQDTSYPSYMDGTTLTIEAPTDPDTIGSDDANGIPASGSEPDSLPVTADTMADQADLSGDASCTTTSVDCVTYAGLPEVDSVSTGETDSFDGNVAATASDSGGSDDTGGTPLTISGKGLSDVTGPLEFVDNIVNPIYLAQYSVATQYSYTPGDSTITTETVSQNPALVDTVACSMSGCSASGQTQTGAPVNPGDLVLLYPPGNPVITSIQTASGPPLGGTLVTINGENLGCVTRVSFGANSAEAFSQEQALLDCGSPSQIVVLAPPGTAGQPVSITLSTIESDVAPGGTAAISPTVFTYDPVNPSVPSSTSFGSVNLGSATTTTVMLSNPSAATQPLYPGGQGDSAPAVITGVDAAEFRITNDGCSGVTLIPGESCGFQLQFAPTASGSRNATLDIPWNNSAGVDGTSIPDLTVALAGTGTEPANTVTDTITNTVTNTVTTAGPSTTTTIVKTVTEKVTCTITVRWKWVTVKVHGKKKREYKKVTTRSKGCPSTAAKKAAKPKKKHEKPSGKHSKRRRRRAL